MSTTNFTNGVTLTDAGWFNDVDAAVYEGTFPAGLSSINVNVSTFNLLATPTTLTVGAGASTELNIGNASAPITAVGGVAISAGKVLTFGDTLSFTATYVGGTTAPADTAYYRKIGNAVILSLPYLTATSNSGSFQVSGLPAALIPTTDRFFPVVIQNNGTWEIGLLRILSTGVIDIRADAAGNSFSAVGAKTLLNGNVSYFLD